jgi:hypothetical protein
MFFKTSTVYKVYQTENGAKRYIARFLANRENISIEIHSGMFYVVAN